jgi:hypothetical protein
MLRVVNMIPNAVSFETNQDSEPNLAVNALFPRAIAGSAFTPNPFGGTNAPIFVSQNGGRTWLLNPIVPSSGGASTGDITLRFAPRSNNLYLGILRRPGSLRLNILRTANFLSAALATVLVDRNQVDQPYVQTSPLPGPDRVYVGDNDFAALPRTATIDESQNAAGAPPAGFTSVRIDKRATTTPQDGPPIRPAAHWDGTVYAAFYRWTAFTGSVATAEVVVVRDDNYGAGANPFTALTDPTDGVAGRKVMVNLTIPWANISQPAFGQERFVGSNLSIAVDPWNSSRVYIAWADRLGATDYTLHVRRSTDRGATWSADIRTITNATNPALAVNESGAVGFMYQRVTGPVAAQRWATILELTSDEFASAVDLVLADVPANAPAPQFVPYIGDYIHLLALGNDFYGIFSANNTPDNANFPSGVTYQRNANFATRTLQDATGATVNPSIDPFFVNATGQMGSAAVAWASDRLDLFVVGTDQGLYHKWWDGSGWGPSVLGWEGLGGVCIGSPVVESWGPDRLDVLVVGTDEALYHKWWDGSAWGPSVTGWESLGGLIQPAPMRKPSIVAWGPNRLDIFVVGIDGALYHKWWDGSAWGPSVTGWESLGGVCASSPAAVSWAPDRLDVFVIGTDGALWHRWWDGSTWGGWESLGGVCIGTPAAVAWAANRLDLFVIGTDGALYHKWWDGAAWGPSVTDWEPLGGVCASSPTAVAWAADRLDLFVLGTDQLLYHKWWDGSGWGPSVLGWEPLGGVIRGGPTAVSWAANRLDLCAVGTDRALYHKWWDGSGWGPSVLGWEPLGGVIDF